MSKPSVKESGKYVHGGKDANNSIWFLLRKRTKICGGIGEKDRHRDEKL